MRPPIHQPFKDGRGGIEIGLKPIEDRDWLEIDELFNQEIQDKLTLIEERRSEVIVSNKNSLGSQRELLNIVLEHLSTYHSEIYDVQKSCITSKKNDQTLFYDDFKDPIELASLVVQEDLVIMHPIKDVFYLEAASVCAPTRWSLTDKYKKSLSEIHAEVPNYQEKLDTRVGKIFKNLPDNRIFERFNWGIVDSPELYQPINSKTLVEIENTNPEDLFIRSERQTIRRLEKNRSVVFTIRVHVDPISSILDTNDLKEDLFKAIINLEEPMKNYKVIKPFEEKLLEWLKNNS